MYRLLLAAAFTFAAASITPARHAAADDKEVAEVKKKIAEWEAVLVKNKAATVKAEAAVKAADDEYKRVKEMGLDRLAELKNISDKALKGPAEKAAAARKDADKTAKELGEVARARDAASGKLGTTTDPKEAEVLKKTLDELEVVFREKGQTAKKAEVVAKEADQAYKETIAALSKGLLDVQKTNDEAAFAELKKTAAARRDLAQLREERDRAETDIRKLKIKLEQLGK